MLIHHTNQNLIKNLKATKCIFKSVISNFFDQQVYIDTYSVIVYII